MRLPKDMIIHIDTELAGDEVRVIAEPQGELVRCKDCRHYDKHETYSLCTYWSGDPYEQATVDDNDFCSYGERKGGEDDGKD